jgi:hypothetical protein
MSLKYWNFVQTPSDLIDKLPASEYGPNDYSELQGTGHASSIPGNPGATRLFLVNYTSLPLFLDDLQGYTTISSTNQLQRVVPDRHPLWANLYCMEAEIDGIGTIGQYEGVALAKYPLAKVTAMYRAPSYKIAEDVPTRFLSSGTTSKEGGAPQGAGFEMDRYTTRKWNFGADAITINTAGLKFVSNRRETLAGVQNVSIGQPPARVTMTWELSYTWHEIPPSPRAIASVLPTDTPIVNAGYPGAISPYVPPNLQQIVNCYGKVNSVPFDVNHLNAPPGCVLFVGCQPVMRNLRLTTGVDENNLFHDIQFKFLYKNNGYYTRGEADYYLKEYAGWNWFYDQAGGGHPRTPLNVKLTSGSQFMECDTINGVYKNAPITHPLIPPGTGIVGILPGEKNKIEISSPVNPLPGGFSFKNIKATVFYGGEPVVGRWDLVTVEGTAKGNRLNEAADLNLLWTIS